MMAPQLSGADLHFEVVGSRDEAPDVGRLQEAFSGPADGHFAEDLLVLLWRPQAPRRKCFGFGC